jgi:monoamine oxidase
VNVVVVGAGLAGLTAADLLHGAGVPVHVLEGRDFVGGRTMTLRPEGLGDGAWFDVGATWHWTDQPRVRALARELQFEVFPQYRSGRAVVENQPGAPPEPIDLPSPDPVELRFVGGAQRLCERLADRLPAGTVSLRTPVVAIEEEETGLTVSVINPDGRGSELAAEYAIVAAPPRLLVDGIALSPPLPDQLVDVIKATPTWMATMLKCVAVYESPFWRDDGWSGLALSQPGCGALREVHDACNDDGSVAALWGFLTGYHEIRDLSFDDRLEHVFGHLGRLFGPQAADPLRYFERDWSTDPYTADEVVWVKESLAYGHPALHQPVLGGRLFLAGTETSTEGGGHMEGAIQSGQRAAGQILEAAGAEG